MLRQVLETLAQDLEERGELDLSECFIDGTFAAAKKGGAEVGKTKRGRKAFSRAYHAVINAHCVYDQMLPAANGSLGSKVMAISDAHGTCLALHVTSASPHEVRLVHQTLASRHVRSKADKLIGDRAYDSDPLDAELAEQGVEMISPHRRNRKKAKTQDGRKLRRYKGRWKIERLFAHLGNFRRLVIRYEHYSQNFLAFLHLSCIKLLLKRF